jgi:hypothetical protein
VSVGVNTLNIGKLLDEQHKAMSNAIKAVYTYTEDEHFLFKTLKPGKVSFADFANMFLGILRRVGC